MLESVDSPAWRRFEIDGETYYWTAYPSQTRIGEGPWSPIEYLTVSRAVDTPGVGEGFPSGAVVTEQNAIDLVRLVKSERGALP
jgi:hypothetical protein